MSTRGRRGGWDAPILVLEGNAVRNRLESAGKGGSSAMCWTPEPGEEGEERRRRRGKEG